MPPLPQYSTGAIALPPAQAAASHPALALAQQSAYASANYSDHSTGIRNQGGRGTCVGFGVSKVVETWTGMLFGNAIPWVSPLDLYNLALTYDGLADYRKVHPGDGTYVWAAAKALMVAGVATEQACPYVEAQVGTGRMNVTRTTEYRIDTYSIGYGVDTLKAALQIGPVAVVVICDAPLFVAANGVVDLDSTAPFNEAHCLPVLGYDADLSRFLVANSWGRSWGLGGYAWLTEAWVSQRGQDITSFSPNVTLKIPGDVNADSRITAADVTLALADVVGKRQMTDTVRRVLDINHDNSLDVRDALQILRSWIA